jgi:hypothetical protein
MVSKILVVKLYYITFSEIIHVIVKNVLYLKTQKPNAYEKKNGEYFNPKTAKKIIAERLKIETDWKKVKEKISPIFDEMWNNAKKLGITCNEPRLELKHKEVRMRIDEPRQYRHENEYGGDTTSSKEYQRYSMLSSKIHDLMETFAKKWNLKVSIAASWSY